MNENILDIVADLLGWPNLFKGILPDKPDTLSALFEYQGEPPTHYFGSTARPYYVQLRCRAPAPDTAYQMALSGQNALDRYSNQRLVIQQQTAILDIGQDGANPPRQEYTVNFRINFLEE